MYYIKLFFIKHDKYTDEYMRERIITDWFIFAYFKVE